MTTEIADLESAAERIKYSGEIRLADVELVEAGLDSADRAVRKLATEAVASVPGDALSDPDDAVATLLETLDTGDLVLAIAASRALARLAPSIPGAIVAVAPRLGAHIDAHNVWVSDNVTAALRPAARSTPEAVVPHVSDYVAPDRWTSTERNTLRNAVSVVHTAAGTAPESVVSVVPALLDLLEQSPQTPLVVLETLATVAETFPSRITRAIPALRGCATGLSGPPAEAAIDALVGIATEEPSLARSVVPTLTVHLTQSEKNRPVEVATALVRIVETCPEERETVLAELSESDGFGRLRAGRAFVATGTETGQQLAEQALDGSPLRRFLPLSSSSKA